jgi:hypothetical protein
MKLVMFSIYYAKLQLLVQLGLHHTSNPLDLGWRWKYWKRRRTDGRQVRY